MIDEGDLKPTTLVGDPLYLIVAEPPGNALVGFNFKQRTTEVLASTRRRPAVSPFDDPGLQIKSAVTNEAGEVVVVAETIARPVPQIERVIHAWSPTQRLWREIHPGTSKSTVPLNLQQPADSEYPRVGRLANRAATLSSTFSERTLPTSRLAFPRAAAVRLPESRYGPQNIRPDYCNPFRGGVVLVPASGAGFWVILQKEMDDYLQSIAAIKPAQSASN